MKLTKIQTEISDSIRSLIQFKCSNKTHNLISDDIWWKIIDEIRTPNLESIEDMQIRTLNNLKNEIN